MALERLMTTTALGLALAVTPAMSQETPQPDTADTQSMRSESMNQGNVQQPDEPVAGEIGEIEFLRETTRDQHLASALIGQPVYDSTDKQVGDVDDLLTSSDGKVVAAVIGTGGFLGLDERHVAVPYDMLRTIQPAGGELKVTLRFDPEKLDSAPNFERTRKTAAKSQ